MQLENQNVAVGYNGNQLTQNTLNIDYLILNLVGDLDLYKINLEDTNIHFEAKEYGTKIFESAHDVYYYGIKMGSILSHPRSKILSSELTQFQFENNLFYTNPLSDLKEFLFNFTDVTGLHFQSINRLDIAIDKTDLKGDYRKLMNEILNGHKIVSGRSKNIRCEYETVNGRPVMNGFTVGKRSASRFLRVYNKTLEMLNKPKEYIYKNWQENGLDTTSIWRFEYQLNNTFFTYLKNSKIEDVTWCIFDNLYLLRLVQMAEKNHFEICENTNKAQINAEKKIQLFDWDALANKICSQRTVILERIKRTINSSFLVYKRFIKACFREYYISKQDISFIIPLNRFVEDIQCIDERKEIQKWFYTKVPYYVKEFQQKNISVQKFNYSQFVTDLKIFL